MYYARALCQRVNPQVFGSRFGADPSPEPLAQSTARALLADPNKGPNLTLMFQRQFNKGGGVPTLKEDGVWGPNTSAAVNKLVTVGYGGGVTGLATAPAQPITVPVPVEPSAKSKAITLALTALAVGLVADAIYVGVTIYEKRKAAAAQNPAYKRLGNVSVNYAMHQKPLIDGNPFSQPLARQHAADEALVRDLNRQAERSKARNVQNFPAVYK